MKQYEILEHKGDFKIRVFGKTKQELFLNALLGMESGLRPEIDFRNQQYLDARLRRAGIGKSRHIKIKSQDSNALLVDFLSEALYLIQTNKEVYNKADFKKFSDTELEADLFGQKVEIFGEDIKAVTYHGLNIRQDNSGIWQTEILFDI